MELDGVGEKLVDQLLESSLVTNIADLYRLDKEDICSLDRMGEKSAENVLSELETSKKMSLSKFIHALGMNAIGPELATLLANHFISLESILEWRTKCEGVNGMNTEILHSIVQLDGVGEKLAVLLYEGLTSKLDIIHDIRDYLEIKNQEVTEAKGNLIGMTFCVTGSLSKPRKEIQELIKSAGGKVVGSVSKSLDILVAGEKAGSKLTKAQGFGIAVWSEEELLKQISSDEDGNVGNSDQETNNSDDENKPNRQTLFDF